MQTLPTRHAPTARVVLAAVLCATLGGAYVLGQGFGQTPAKLDIVKVKDAFYRYWVNPQSKHKQGWRDRKWQVETHQRVVRELDEWEALRA